MRTWLCAPDPAPWLLLLLYLLLYDYYMISILGYIATIISLSSVITIFCVHYISIATIISIIMIVLLYYCYFDYSCLIFIDSRGSCWLAAAKQKSSRSLLVQELANLWAVQQGFEVESGHNNRQEKDRTSKFISNIVNIRESSKRNGWTSMQSPCPGNL